MDKEKKLGVVEWQKVIEPYRREIHDRFTVLMQNAGYSAQRLFAEEVGISPSAWNMLICGKMRPSPRTAVHIANTLGIEIDEFYSILRLPEDDVKAAKQYEERFSTRGSKECPGIFYKMYDMLVQRLEGVFDECDINRKAKIMSDLESLIEKYKG